MSLVATRIREWLDSSGIEYRWLEHRPAETSEDSARVRGEPLEIGGKAIVMKVDDEFRILVLSAASQIDSGAIKRHFGAKKLRFATATELDELTGLVPGSVPPFGEPILPLKLSVDRSIEENGRIAFNCGALTESIIMSTRDYLDLAKPEVFEFGRAP